MGPSLSSRELAAYSPIASTRSNFWSARLSPSPQSSRRLEVLASVRGQRRAAYMMASKEGELVSLSSVAWFAGSDQLRMLRLHQFHRPHKRREPRQELELQPNGLSLPILSHLRIRSIVICLIKSKQTTMTSRIIYHIAATWLCWQPTYWAPSNNRLA